MKRITFLRSAFIGGLICSCVSLSPAQSMAASSGSIPNVTLRENGSLSVSLENSSDSAIVCYVLRMDYKDAAGKPAGETFVRDMRSSGHQLMPGSAEVYTVPGSIASRMSQAAGVVSVSLDSVLYADGKFAGPDQVGFFGVSEFEYGLYQQLREDKQLASAASPAAISSALQKYIDALATQASASSDAFRRMEISKVRAELTMVQAQSAAGTSRENILAYVNRTAAKAPFRSLQ